MTAQAASKPTFFATCSSRPSTFAWSPSNRSRKLACVPVVPLTPRQGRPLGTMLDLLQVEQQVLDPQAGALADGGGLGRLEVGEAERGQVPVLAGRSAARAAITRSERRATRSQGRRASG